MEGGNSGQNKQQTNQQKAGLSWTQPPAATAQNTSAQKAVEAASSDSTGSIIGIVVGVIVVFALAAWGIVALNKRSAPSVVSTATTTSETKTPETTTPKPNTSRGGKRCVYGRNTRCRKYCCCSGYDAHRANVGHCVRES